MLTLTKPKYFLPVHGEYKQLKKHALTAASLGIQMCIRDRVWSSP